MVTLLCLSASYLGMPSPGTTWIAATRLIRNALGILLTVLSALCVVWVFRHAAHPAIAPFIFVLVLTLIAREFGAQSAFLGTLLSAGVFAYFLFAPIGSLQVADDNARRNLFWMLLCGIVISEFVPSVSVSKDQRK